MKSNVVELSPKKHIDLLGYIHSCLDNAIQCLDGVCDELKSEKNAWFTDDVEKVIAEIVALKTLLPSEKDEAE